MTLHEALNLACGPMLLAMSLLAWKYQRDLAKVRGELTRRTECAYQAELRLKRTNYVSWVEHIAKFPAEPLPRKVGR